MAWCGSDTEAGGAAGRCDGAPAAAELLKEKGLDGAVRGRNGKEFNQFLCRELRDMKVYWHLERGMR